MIAIDTNVLLRYLLQDDDLQSEKANKLFEDNEEILITDIVLLEMVWTLRGKRYQLSKAKIIDTLHRLIEEPNTVFEDGHAVWCALDDYINAEPIKSNGKIKQADFADALIVNKSQRYGVKNNKQVSSLYTFDKAALAIDGTKGPT